MPLRTSAAVFWCKVNIQPALSASTPAPSSASYHSAPNGQRWPQSRQYGTTHDEDHRLNDARRSSRARHSWPAAKTPSPYDILGMNRGAPYCKSKYYELVKLYHPDRKHHTSYDGLPYAVKLERYRLVVAANDILRDAAKRRAYDLFGAGWTTEQPHQQKSHREADFSWRQQPGNASNNATWEDWERWYHARDGKKPEPRYISNGGFVLVVALFVLAGGWGQGVRAGRRSTSMIELRDQQNAMIHGELRRRQSRSAPLSREGRVDSFLRQREGSGFDDSAKQTPGSSAHK